MAEREWREASDLKPATVWLIVAIAGGALLRFWALGSGLPYSPGVDEPAVMDRVVHMLRTGDFNPHFFDYPGLIFYLHVPLACLKFLHGAANGAWLTLDQTQPVEFLRWGRALTAILGTATIFVVHQIGMRWGARHALLAAALFAFLPMHVRESHYVLTDVPMTFFVALAMLQTLRASEKPTMLAFALAGAAAGLATGTKYNGGLALLLPVMAAWSTLHAPMPRVVLVCVSIASWAVAFLVVAPYTILDLPNFLNAFAYLFTFFRPRNEFAEPGWLVYLKHLRLTLGWPASLLLVGGMCMAAVRAIKGPGRLRWGLVFVFPVLYIWYIADRHLIYGRYLLPVLPFVSVVASAAVVSGVSLLRRFAIPRAARTTLIVALTVAALLPPLQTSISWVREAGRPSTKDAFWIWFEANVPKDAPVVFEQFDIRPTARYRKIEYVSRLTDRTYDDYKNAGVRFLVASSSVYNQVLNDPRARPDLAGAYNDIFGRGREAVRVSPTDRRPGPEFRVIEIR